MQSSYRTIWIEIGSFYAKSVVNSIVKLLEIVNDNSFFHSTRIKEEMMIKVLAFIKEHRHLFKAL